mgnify:CR=1 FL=1
MTNVDDRLLDDYLLAIATGYALHKELGVIDRCNDLSVKVQKKRDFFL